MFDHEIQRATTAELERKLRELGPYPDNAGTIDLGIRIAKELRYRNRHQQPRDDRPRLRLMRS